MNSDRMLNEQLIISFTQQQNGFLREIFPFSNLVRKISLRNLNRGRYFPGDDLHEPMNDRERRIETSSLYFPRMSSMNDLSSNIRCEYCTTTFSSQFAYEQHVQNCPKVLLVCPFKNFGCHFQV